MIRDIYTYLSTSYITMLATAEYSDIRCWPCHYCTVLFIVLSLGHNLCTYIETLTEQSMYNPYPKVLVKQQKHSQKGQKWLS